MAATSTSLYLNWQLLRDLVGLKPTDAEIAAEVFTGDEPAPKFSKVLMGENHLQPEIADELARVVNRHIARVIRARGGEVGPDNQMRGTDFEKSVSTFARSLVQALGEVDETTQDRAQSNLMESLAPIYRTGAEAGRLTVERYAISRSFVGAVPSGDGPTVFNARQHQGQLVVSGLSRTPAMTYTLLVRDPRPAGLRFWDLDWPQCVFWLPAPDRPQLRDGLLPLMPEPQRLRPDPGRFFVTAVLVWHDETRAVLDPRGPDAPQGALDEPQTARFLVNLRRLVRARKDEAPVTACRAEYLVKT